MIYDSALLLAELIVLFFGVAFVVQLIQLRFGAERLRAWMGGRPVVAALKGIAVGFVTPFCTYSAIPMLVGFRQAGVPPAGYVAFITAAPVLDPVLFGALMLIVGVEAALIYAAVAFFAALALALFAQRAGIEHLLKPVSAHLGGANLPTAVNAEPSCTGSLPDDEGDFPGCATADRGSRIELRNDIGIAARSAVALLRSVAALLIVGVAVGLVIESTVSPDAVARLTAYSGAFAIPIAAALGTPLYFDTSLFVPIADSLSNTGVGAGAIVALTIAGSGANVPEFIILRKLAISRLIVLFFGYVFTVAVAGGLIAQVLVG